jgi:tRNA uridine 5-carboxymethylaminomethyl modification enzyme
MFTSRAEFRTLLRQDNADIRLTPLAHRLGLASDERLFHVEQKVRYTADFRNYLDKLSISPEEINPFLESAGTSPITQRVRFESILSRPQVDLAAVLPYIPQIASKASEYGFQYLEVMEQAEIDLKY